MAFDPKDWFNKPNTATPLNAWNLTDMQNVIVDYILGLLEQMNSIVVHGDDANVSRPTAGLVTWIGSVEPVNMANGDLWSVRQDDKTIHLIGDPHFPDFTSRLDDVTAGKDTLDADLRICVGDLTDDADEGESQDAPALAWCEEMGVDYVVPGNHDVTDYSTATYNVRTPDEFAEIFTDFMDGNTTANYVVDVGFANFIFIGDVPDTPVRTLPPEGLEWLADVVAGLTKKSFCVSHYPLQGTVGDALSEPQFRTNGGTAATYLNPDGDIRAILNDSEHVIAWICGHTHTAVDALDLFKLHATGEYPAGQLDQLPNLLGTPGSKYPSAITRGYSNLLTANQAGFESGTTDGSTAGTATINTFSTTSAWSVQGSNALHFKATGGGSNQTGYWQTAQIDVTPENRYSVEYTMNLLSHGAKMPSIVIAWYDNASAYLSSSPASPPLDEPPGLGVYKLRVAGVAPANAAKCRIQIGNFSYNSRYLQSAEVVEFYLDDGWFSSPDVAIPDSDAKYGFDDGFAGWYSQVGGTSTVDDFGLSDDWAPEGKSRSLHFEASIGTGSETGYIYSEYITVAAGEIIAMAIPVNIVEKGAKGPRIFVTFRDEDNVVLDGETIGGTPIEETGEGMFYFRCVVPAGCTSMRIYIGNSSVSYRGLQNGEKLDMYVGNMRIARPTGPPPGRSIAHISCSAPSYTGKNEDASDIVGSVWMTDRVNEIELRFRDDGNNQWLPVAGQEKTVFTFDQPTQYVKLNGQLVVL